MEYMRWSKVHRQVRYELTPSGVPAVSPDELGFDAAALRLDVRGSYGDPALVDLIARRYGVGQAGVMPVPGASSANFIALAVAARRGQAIMLEEPAYGPLPLAAEFLGLTIIPIPRSPASGFELPREAVEAGLRQGARALVLTNLHNPSGRLLSLEAMSELVATCRRSNASLIVDEVYLDGACIAKGEPLWTAARLGDNVIVTNSLTKVYGLSGLRIGWIIAEAARIERAQEVMDLLSVNNAAPSAALAIHALERIAMLEARFHRIYSAGRAVFDAWLAHEPRVRSYERYGAAFECLRLPDGMDSRAFNERLATKFDTQVVPGAFFGLNDHIRLSTVVPPDDLREGLARISACLSKQ